MKLPLADSRRELTAVILRCLRLFPDPQGYLPIAWLKRTRSEALSESAAF
jgi:hypothetical protein